MGLFQLEKHEIVAVHVSIRHEKRTRATKQGGRTSEGGIIEGASGQTGYGSGQVGTTGRVKDNSVKHWKTRKIVTVAHESVKMLDDTQQIR